VIPAPRSEQRLEQLLHVTDFPPPPEFAGHATVADPAVYEQAAADPQAWWAGQARQRLAWDTPFTEILDDTNPPFYRWFADGTLNVSYNCLDRHVQAGHGDRVAFHWHGEEGEQRDLTYASLLADVQRLANGLKARGVGRGDVVGIYLPMIPEVVVAMLACARIGAPHTVIFGGFAPSAVRERLETSAAKALITPTAPAARAGPPRSRPPSMRRCRTWPRWRRSWWSGRPAPRARCGRAGTSGTTTC
jgi:acetyl-CoA synthetase